MLDHEGQATGGQSETLPVEFKFRDHSIRTLMKDGEARFVHNDVCAALGLTNPSDALSRLDDDEKGVALTETLGGPQEMNVINEFGLYRLILRSNKPNAKAFQRWLIHDVLPAIRKTGRYEAQQQEPRPEIDSSVTILSSRTSRHLLGRPSDSQPTFSAFTTNTAMLRLNGSSAALTAYTRRAQRVFCDECGNAGGLVSCSRRPGRSSSLASIRLDPREAPL